MNTWGIPKKCPKNSQSFKKIQTHEFVGKKDKKTAAAAAAALSVKFRSGEERKKQRILFFSILQRFLRYFSGTGNRTKCRFRHKTGPDRNQAIQ